MDPHVVPSLVDGNNGSENTSSRLSTTSISTSGRLSLSDLQQAVDLLQRENLLMTKELKELRAENAKYAAANHKGKKSGTTEPGGESLQSEIDKVARAYQVFGSTVIDAAAFSLPRPTFSPTDPDRYEDDVKMILGTTSELYTFIPAKFHELISTKRFAKDFMAAMQTGRSSSILRIREKAGLIFDLSQDYFVCGFVRSAIPEIRQLLALDIRPGNKYARLPPCLYKNNNDKKQVYMFFNPALIKIARVAIYGPSALTSNRCVLRSSSPFYQVDRPVSTTDGLIVWCALMARFLLSDDTEFSGTGIGAKSGFNYMNDGDYYKRILVQLRESQPDWIDRLYKKWNDDIFPNIDTAASQEPVPADQVPSDHDADELRELRHAMRLEVEQGFSDSESEAQSQLVPSAAVPQGPQLQMASNVRTTATIPVENIDDIYVYDTPSESEAPKSQSNAAIQPRQIPSAGNQHALAQDILDSAEPATAAPPTRRRGARNATTTARGNKKKART